MLQLCAAEKIKKKTKNLVQSGVRKYYLLVLNVAVCASLVLYVFHMHILCCRAVLIL